MKPPCTRDGCPLNGQVHPKCTGHVKGLNPEREHRRGQPCNQWPMEGQNVCRMHGGKSQQAKRAAAARVTTRAVQADAQALLAHEGLAGIDNPLDEIARLAVEALAFKDALAARVNALHEITDVDQKGTEQIAGEVVLYERALDRTVRFLDVLAKSGFEERRVQLAEGQALMVAEVIRRILAELRLSPEQEALVGVVVPAQLRAIGSEVEGA